LALWLTPLLLLIGTVVVLRRNARAAATGRQEVVPLSDAEKKRLDDLLGKGS
jgi:cytochrome c-type biogenesis protein CcmH/NrfF